MVIVCYNVISVTMLAVHAGSVQSGSEEEHQEDASTSYRRRTGPSPAYPRDLEAYPSDSDPEGHYHHHRRRRSFYSRCQLSFLESAFRCAGHYPDQRQREQLARALNVTEARVQV